MTNNAMETQFESFMHVVCVTQAIWPMKEKGCINIQSIELSTSMKEFA